MTKPIITTGARVGLNGSLTTDEVASKSGGQARVGECTIWVHRYGPLVVVDGPEAAVWCETRPLEATPQVLGVGFGIV